MAGYKLLGELGRGAMGVVYRAVQLELDREVALKLLALECLDDISAVKRFQTEAQALAGLDHPNIIRVIDTGVMDRRPYMAMDLVEGVDLQTVRETRGRQRLDDVLRWMIQIADALKTIHAAGLVHRDIKPTNIVVSERGHITLLDFGLVRTQLPQSLTEPGMVVGTPRYLAPEAVVGGPCGPGLDIFALGLGMMELIIGEAWSDEGDAEAVMRRIMMGEIPRLRDLVPRLPGWVHAVHERMLEAQPEKRITAAQLVDELSTHGIRASIPPQPGAGEVSVAGPARELTPDTLAGPPPPPGYTLGAEIGAGAMGMVFRAKQERLGREVALKLMRPGLATSDAFRERFRREALAMSRVSHPSLIKVFDVGEAGGLPYIAMELVSGRSLEAAIQASPAEVRRRADTLFEAIADAVAVLHAAGLSHRDLKPANVMVTADWKPVVMDLGLVKDFTGDGTALTKTGALLGTPAYLAPEVLKGEEASTSSDVWALGCIYFAMAAGFPAFASDSLPGLYESILSVRLPDLTQALGDLTPSRRTFVQRLLVAQRAERPADARRALELFRKALAGAPITPRSVSRPSRPLRSNVSQNTETSPRRRAGRAVLAMGLAAALSWLGWTRFRATSPVLAAVASPSRAAPSVRVSASPAAPRGAALDAELRALDAPRLLDQLCGELKKRHSKKAVKGEEAALRVTWRAAMEEALARSELRRWLADAVRDPKVAETDDPQTRYRLLTDIWALVGQCEELGVALELDLAPLYPAHHRPDDRLSIVRSPTGPKAEWDALHGGLERLAALIKDGETVGVRFCDGYGYGAAAAEQAKIDYRNPTGHSVHFFTALGGQEWGQDVDDLGVVQERLDYRTDRPIPFRPARPGERVLFDTCLKSLGPTERMQFRLSHDGKAWSSPLWTLRGIDEKGTRDYFHWIDPSLVAEPAYLKIEYQQCDSVVPSGDAAVLWLLFHYVKVKP